MFLDKRERAVWRGRKGRKKGRNKKVRRGKSRGRKEKKGRGGEEEIVKNILAIKK